MINFLPKFDEIGVGDEGCKFFLVFGGGDVFFR